MESLVTDVRYTVFIRFPIIAQRSKGAHYFHRVVGLVVISMSVMALFHPHEAPRSQGSWVVCVGSEILKLKILGHNKKSSSLHVIAHKEYHD